MSAALALAAEGAVEPDGLSLVDAPLGQPLVVVDIEGTDPARLARLSGLGIIPGSRAVLRQRHPSYVLQTGETWLAIERAVAAIVKVRAV